MNNLRPLTATALMASTLLLSACGGGIGPDGGNSGKYETISPIEGVSLDTTHRLGVREGQDVENDFDFVNYVAPNDGGHHSGYIQVVGGNENDDGSIRNAIVSTVFRIGDNGRSRNDTRYHSDYHDTEPGEDPSDKRIVIERLDVDGNPNTDEFVHAREDVNATGNKRNPNWETQSFVYLPADERGHVGMAGNAGKSSRSWEARVGIFGARTSAAEVAAQQGNATYTGVTTAYLGNGGSEHTNGEYQGQVSATVDFNADGGPSFRTGVLKPTDGMTSTVDGGNMAYSVTGTIAPNGRLNASRATLAGSDANDHVVGGALFGPDADSLGYAYTITGDTLPDGNGPVALSGGAVLNRD